MGILTFKVVSLELMNETTAFMIGRWDLDRIEKAGGHFSLIWKKLTLENGLCHRPLLID